MKATILNAANRARVEERSPYLVAASIGWCGRRRDGSARDASPHGFGAAAHILARNCRRQRREVHALICPGDETAHAHARSVDASKTRTFGDKTPVPLDAGTIFAPTGALVPLAEIAIVKGGRLVRGGVHMNDIPGFGYVSLRYESDLISVAKLTRADRLEFPPLARRLAAAVLVP